MKKPPKLTRYTTYLLKKIVKKITNGPVRCALFWTAIWWMIARFVTLWELCTKESLLNLKLLKKSNQSKLKLFKNLKKKNPRNRNSKKTNPKKRNRKKRNPKKRNTNSGIAQPALSKTETAIFGAKFVPPKNLMFHPQASQLSKPIHLSKLKKSKKRTNLLIKRKNLAKKYNLLK